MNKRKTQSNIRHNLSRKRGITRRKSDLNSMYSEGFIRRMSEPLHLIPISENDERVIRHRQLYPPETRTDDEIQEEYFVRILKEREDEKKKNSLLHL